MGGQSGVIKLNASVNVKICHIVRGEKIAGKPTNMPFNAPDKDTSSKVAHFPDAAVITNENVKVTKQMTERQDGEKGPMKKLQGFQAMK